MSARRIVIATVLMLALAVGAAYWFWFSKPEKIVHKDVRSVRVEEIPALGAQSFDSSWSQAEPLEADNLTLRSIHDDSRVALLFEWPDPTLSLGTSGAWQLRDGKWRRNRDIAEWESFAGERHPEWLGVYWNIDSPDFAREGCTATCHEGTGKHHRTPTVGEHVDTWHLIAKHGWGPTFLEDQGWLLGSGSALQQGDVRFANEAMDPRQAVTGAFTFQGYGEDGMLSNPEDEAVDRHTAAAEYCGTCHDTPDSVTGDTGDIPYGRNSSADGEGPRYIETQPQDFLDAMVITGSEVGSGEAAEVASLGEAGLLSAWRTYETFNATVPELVLSTPSGSAADLAVSASWENGRWRLQVVRDLVTAEADDVEFDDLGKEYGFAVSLWDKSDLAADLRMFPLLLTFEE